MGVCLNPLPLTGWISPWFRAYEVSHMPLGRTPSKIDQNRSVMPIQEWVDFGHFQYWRSWVQIPESTFFQNFYCQDTCGSLTSREGVRPSFRLIRGIWQEIMNFEISILLVFFQKKWGFESRDRPFWNLYPVGPWGFLTPQKSPLTAWEFLYSTWEHPDTNMTML